ncbi:MAG: DUF3244 domain-containing protein [Paludibacter sp.]|nr:DUF3244 domain-containing protein [Paludibacter sp.]
MKKINLPLFSILMLLLFTLPFQSTSARDVPIKSEDPSDYNIPSTGTRAPVSIALNVTQNETDVTLNFLYPVGTALVTVENENGEVVYLETVDTFTTLDAYIDTQNFDGGVYTLKISYGSTNLVGEFEL